MKPQIKKCKGFNETLCSRCKRQDTKAENTLVNHLSSPISTDKKVCQHYIFGR